MVVEKPSRCTSGAACAAAAACFPAAIPSKTPKQRGTVGGAANRKASESKGERVAWPRSHDLKGEEAGALKVQPHRRTGGGGSFSSTAAAAAAAATAAGDNGDETWTF
jgi:hypothetical protein